MDSPWQPLVVGRTITDPTTGTLTAVMRFLPHRLEYPDFVVPAFSDESVILAHVGARLQMADTDLHVDFGPLVHHSPTSQEWTVWRDEPWPALDTLLTATTPGLPEPLDRPDRPGWTDPTRAPSDPFALLLLV